MNFQGFQANILVYAESESNLCFGLPLFLQEVLAIFCPNSWQIYAPVFRDKLQPRNNLGTIKECNIVFGTIKSILGYMENKQDVILSTS